jgi:hypothetical protein
MSLQLGAQLFVLTAYEKQDGTIACSKYKPKPKYCFNQQIANGFTDFKLSHVVVIPLLTRNPIGKMAFGRSGCNMPEINMVSV